LRSVGQEFSVFPSERLKGIDVFVAVAAAGSFTLAAERLSLTSSAVGKAIARLETRLGTRLFERTTRRLWLSDAGLAFHRVCVRVLDELESAERVLAAEADAPSGRLRVDLPTTFGRLCAMGPLCDFAQHHPAVQPHVSFTDRFVDLVDEGIDVAVRIGSPPTWPLNLGQRLLGTERLVFCASPDYLTRRGTPRSLDELAEHDAISYGRADGSVSPWLIPVADGPPERRSVDSRFVAGHAEAQLDVVVAGLGVAQLATWLVDAHLKAGRLLPILEAHAVDGLPLHLVWPVNKQLLPKVDALVKHLTQTLRIR
jgi:DNA-binding transcriptional LysR family regulator